MFKRFFQILFLLVWAALITAAAMGKLSVWWAVGLAAAAILVTLVFGRLFCMYICPIGDIMGIFSKKAHCANFCPLGLCLGQVARASLYKIRIDHARCAGKKVAGWASAPETECSACGDSCRAGAIDAKTLKVDPARCISCLDCVRGVCPKDAISYSPPLKEVFYTKEYNDRKARK